VFFFCDQDDVWEARKLQTVLEFCWTRRADTPLLIVHDASVIDEAGIVRSDSIMRLVGRNRGRNQLASLLCRNTVLGCCSAINWPLLKTLCPVPTEAIMHDWWAAICGAAVGDIVDLTESLARYRQHQGNSIGLRGWRDQLRRAKSFSVFLDYEKLAFFALFAQAKAAEIRISRFSVSAENLAMLRNFAGLPHKSILEGVRSTQALTKGIDTTTRVKLMLKLILCRRKSNKVSSRG